MPAPVRTLAVACPDWPVVAAGAAGAAGDPAVVVHANRVVSCSASARQGGVEVGQRRREAEGLVSPLLVLKNDPARDARMFEPLVSAVAAFTPRVEVIRPGLCSFPTRGPARYFGGERVLVGKVAAAVDALLPAGVRCRVGVADGPFAALLAAELQQLLEKGRSKAFLAPFPVGVLGMPELADLLRRLGIRSLGELGELPVEAMTARFGAEGSEAWHLAAGLDDRALLLGEPPPDLAVSRELDPPAMRVDAAAFVAVGLAEELCARLRVLELACTRIVVEVETEHGETLRRLWRADRPFSVRTMVDRVRWQLEGWLAGVAGDGAGVPSGGVVAPTGAVVVLRLAADEVARHRGRQLGLWGERSEADRRAEQGLARVQGLLGHAGVLTAVRSGGRSPAEQVRLVPWGDPREPDAGAAGRRQAQRRPPPWPGSLPAPSPALVPKEPRTVVVLDEAGGEVGVSGRGELSEPPASVVLGAGTGGSRVRVEGWAGPWPVDERWWDGSAHRRRARLQVLLEGGKAHLLSLEGGKWQLEATYD
jgi:protein ImuB